MLVDLGFEILRNGNGAVFTRFCPVEGDLAVADLIGGELFCLTPASTGTEANLGDDVCTGRPRFERVQEQQDLLGGQVAEFPFLYLELPQIPEWVVAMPFSDSAQFVEHRTEIGMLPVHVAGGDAVPDTLGTIGGKDGSIEGVH